MAQNTSPITITRLKENEINDPSTIAEITSLINGIYRNAESDLWINDPTRTNIDEVTIWCRNNELYVAFEDSSRERAIGTVRITRPTLDVTSFGTLTVLPSFRSVGLGRRLVDFAEAVAAGRGSTEMELELLVPKLPKVHEGKEGLRRWYLKLGYAEVERVQMDEQFPALVGKVCDDVEVLIMRKEMKYD